MIFQSNNKYRHCSFRVPSLFLLTIIGIAFALTFSSLGGLQTPVRVAAQSDDEKKYVVLTFDDGPHPLYTMQMVDILKSKNAPATFFFTGKHMLEHPDVVEQIFNDGFLIGNHSYSHSREVHTSPERVVWELGLTNRILEQITDHQSVLYRAPFLLDYNHMPDEIIDGSEINDHHPVRWVHNEGYINISSFIGSEDYNEDSAYGIIENIESTLAYGRIILLHDGGGDRSATVEALPILIDLLRADGYEIVGLDALLGVEAASLMPPTTIVSLTESVSAGLAGRAYVYVKEVVPVIIWLALVLSLVRIGMVLVYRFLPLKKARGQWKHGVSILIPAYNEEANIEASIRSALSSTLRPLEVIVISDGSTDRTKLLAASLAQEFPSQVTLFSKPNGGKASALNVGIEAAQYPVVVCLDADTLLEPDAVGYLAAHFNDPTVGAVAGTVRVIKNRTLLNIFQTIEYTVGQFMEKQAFNRIFSSVGIVPGAIGAWRKSDLVAVGGYSNDTLAEDQDLTLSMHMVHRKVVYEDRALAYTEVPNTVRAFLYQRSRWVFGGVQCLWKYHRFFFSWRYPQLGLVILPYNLIFSTLLTIMAPLVDIMLVYHLVVGVVPGVLAVLVLFLVIDLAYVSVCLIYERQPLWYLLIVPLQRIFYRFVVSFIMLGAIVKAIEGRRASWRHQIRLGTARDLFAKLFQKPSSRKVG